MNAVDVSGTALGAVLVALALRDVLHTLLHPGGRGALSSRVFRAVWHVGEAVGGPVRRLTGPFGMLATGVLWTGMIILGFALVYLPAVPEGFQAAPGVPLDRDGSLLDALYVSSVAVSTLGLGDVAPTLPWLRAVVALQSLVGFALLSASISWVLSVHPTLLRRRALAARLSTLLQGDRLVLGGPTSAQAVVLHGLAAELVVVRVDLAQQAASAFFRSPPEAGMSLAAALPRLERATEALPPELDDVAAVLRGALAGLADTLRAGLLPLDGEDVRTVLEAHAAVYGR